MYVCMYVCMYVWLKANQKLLYSLGLIDRCCLPLLWATGGEVRLPLVPVKWLFKVLLLSPEWRWAESGPCFCKRPATICICRHDGKGISDGLILMSCVWVSVCTCPIMACRLPSRSRPVCSAPLQAAASRWLVSWVVARTRTSASWIAASCCCCARRSALHIKHRICKAYKKCPILQLNELLQHHHYYYHYYYNKYTSYFASIHAYIHIHTYDIQNPNYQKGHLILSSAVRAFQRE